MRQGSYRTIDRATPSGDAVARARQLAGLFGVFAGATVVFALNQSLEKLGHRDVIVLRHFERKDFCFRCDAEFDFLSLFSD